MYTVIWSGRITVLKDKLIYLHPRGRNTFNLPDIKILPGITGRMEPPPHEIRHQVDYEVRHQLEHEVRHQLEHEVNHQVDYEVRHQLEHEDRL